MDGRGKRQSRRRVFLQIVRELKGGNEKTAAATIRFGVGKMIRRRRRRRCSFVRASVSVLFRRFAATRTLRGANVGGRRRRRGVFGYYGQMNIGLVQNSRGQFVEKFMTRRWEGAPDVIAELSSKRERGFYGRGR